MAPRVLLVHGLWMHAPALAYWARGLRRAGFRPVLFSYRSLLQAPETAMARLRAVALAEPDTHILAHSLGGLVSVKALARMSWKWASTRLHRRQARFHIEAAADDVNRVPRTVVNR